MRKRRCLSILSFICLIAVGWLSVSCNKSASPKQLNLLAWAGYDERSMVEPFEKKFNAKINVKTFVGGDQMFALLTTSHATFDVVVVDPEYIVKLYRAGRLSQLNDADYDFANYFPPFRNFPLTRINGHLYAVLVRWGANGLVYNTEHLSQD